MHFKNRTYMIVHFNLILLLFYLSFCFIIIIFFLPIRINCIFSFIYQLFPCTKALIVEKKFVDISNIFNLNILLLQLLQGMK